MSITTARAAKLQEAEAAYKHAQAESERLRAVRNKALAAAANVGATHSEIAHATGLTRARIGQLFVSIEHEGRHPRARARRRETTRRQRAEARKARAATPSL